MLTFVHGGPGMPEYPVTENYPTGLEENFTVVWVDQRGAGLSSEIYDYTVNYSMSEAYLKKIDAPVKGSYLFKESAHSPIVEEPKKVMQVMQEDVKNGKNDLADNH